MATVELEQQRLLIGGEWVAGALRRGDVGELRSGRGRRGDARRRRRAATTRAAPPTPRGRVPGLVGDAARPSAARCSAARPTSSRSAPSDRRRR